MALDARTFRTALALLVSAAALAGCSTSGRGGVLSSLGLSRNPPDEFVIVARKPLELPPSLRQLPPPEPGAPSRVEPRPEQDARAALIGQPEAPTEAAPSASEQGLLAAIGADDADPQVRRKLATEADDPGQRRYGLTTLFGYKVPDGTEGERLQPLEESDELRSEGVQTPIPPPDYRPVRETVSKL